MSTEGKASSQTPDVRPETPVEAPKNLSDVKRETHDELKKLRKKLEESPKPLTAADIKTAREEATELGKKLHPNDAEGKNLVTAILRFLDAAGKMASATSTVDKIKNTIQEQIDTWKPMYEQLKESIKDFGAVLLKMAAGFFKNTPWLRDILAEASRSDRALLADILKNFPAVAVQEEALKSAFLQKLHENAATIRQARMEKTGIYVSLKKPVTDKEIEDFDAVSLLQMLIDQGKTARKEEQNQQWLMDTSATIAENEQDQLDKAKADKEAVEKQPTVAAAPANAAPPTAQNPPVVPTGTAPAPALPAQGS